MNQKKQRMWLFICVTMTQAVGAQHALYFIKGSLDDFLTHINAPVTTQAFESYITTKEAELKDVEEAARTMWEHDKIEQGNRYLHEHYPRWYNRLRPLMSKNTQTMVAKDTRMHTRIFLYRLALYEDYCAQKAYTQAGLFHSVGRTVKTAWNTTVDWFKGWLPEKEMAQTTVS